MSSPSSGRGVVTRVELARVDGTPLTVVTVPGPPLADDGGIFGGRVLRAIEAGRLELSASVDELPLADFHLVRDLAERLGVIAAQYEVGACRNCLAALPVDPIGADLETLLAPDEDDAPPTGPFALATPVDGITHVHMRPVRVAEVAALWRWCVATDAPLDGAVVRAMGLEGFTRAGTLVADPERLARACNDGSGALGAVLATLFAELNYPPRLRLPVICASCGAVHDVPTPSTREMDASPEGYDVLFGAPDVPNAPERFPDLDEFTDLVGRVADEVFRARDVGNLELIVDEGVPPVDGGGEPLMGSYEPIYDGDEAGYTQVRFVITVYVETFRRMFEEAPFDIEAELRETIDHEVEHHLYHLAGHDPMDEEERRAAREDLERTFGKRRVQRAERAALLAELAAMARFFGWGLLLCGALLAAAWALGLVD